MIRQSVNIMSSVYRCSSHTHCGRTWSFSSQMSQLNFNMIILTHLSLDKMSAILLTTFSNVFLWMKKHEFRLKFQWNLFLRVQLTIFQHWFRYWLGADQVTSHYLNQCWPSSPTHICVTRGDELKQLKLDWPVCYGSLTDMYNASRCVRCHQQMLTAEVANSGHSMIWKCGRVYKNSWTISRQAGAWNVTITRKIG